MVDAVGVKVGGRDGDALVGTRLDRLGRSLRDLANIAHEIDQAGRLSRRTSMPRPLRRVFFGMLAVFATFETDMRRERQIGGIAMAKRQGTYKGGKTRLDRERLKKLPDEGVGPQ